MPKIYDRDCDYCGNHYRGEGRKYCSPQCYDMARANVPPPNENNDPSAPIDYRDYQNKALKKENAKLHKDAKLVDRLVELFEEKIPGIPPAPYVAPRISAEGKTEEPALLVFSDAHFPEIVSREETGGFGYYNADIAFARVEHMINKTLQILLKNLRGE